MDSLVSNWRFKTSVAFCLIGIFSFAWRFDFIFGLKICDVLFLGSAVFLGWSLLIDKLDKDIWHHFSIPARSILLLMAGIMVGSVLGNIWSAIFYPAWSVYWKEVVVEYARMVFSLGLFWLILYLSLRERSFVRWAMIIVVASALSLWLARIPSWHSLFFLGDERLRGPGGDPNYLGSLLAMALIFTAAALLFYLGKKRILFAIIFVLILPLLLWTGSRGAVAGFVAGVIVLGVFYLVDGIDKTKLMGMFLLFVSLAAGVLFTFFAGPPTSDQTVMLRFVRPYVQNSIFSIISIEGFSGIPVTALSDTGGKDRIQLIAMSSSLAVRSPLGFGPLYNYWRPVAFTAKGSQLPAHEIFLEAALRAGWLGFFCLMFLLWLAGKGIADAMDNGNWLHAAVFGAFVAMLVVSLSTDTLTLRWFWVMVAFAASLSQFKEKNFNLYI